MRHAALTFAALLACTAASAQPPAAPPAAPPPVAPAADLPSGDDLYAKHIAAIGGAETLRAKKTSLLKARITRSAGPSGILTIRRQAPGKMHKTLDVPGVATLETWCDGENAWIRNSNKGTSRLSGEALIETKREADIAGEADFKGRFKSLTTTAKITFDDRPAFTVTAVGTDDKPRTLVFDAEKGFLLGVKLPPAAEGQPSILMRFLDYKPAGGLIQPMTVIEEAGSLRSTITYTQLDFDIPIVISLDPPDEVKNVK